MKRDTWRLFIRSSEGRRVESFRLQMDAEARREVLRRELNDGSGRWGLVDLLPPGQEPEEEDVEDGPEKPDEEKDVDMYLRETGKQWTRWR